MIPELPESVKQAKIYLEVTAVTQMKYDIDCKTWDKIVHLLVKTDVSTFSSFFLSSSFVVVAKEQATFM